jgi:RimJ/RimL family protein N-acetyltransferase
VIYELPPSAFGVAEPLFASATFDRVYVDAVFEGRQSGRIFVDDPRQPSGALLCRTYDFFLAGGPSPALRGFIAEAPVEAGVWDGFYGYVPLNEEWSRVLLEDHDGRLEVIGRRSFRFDPHNRDLISEWRSDLPAGITILPIDAALAQRVDRDLHEHIGLCWGAYDRFTAGGFGFCALAGDVPVSTAYAAAVSDGEVNLGVGTDPAFRRQGLAFAVSAACVEWGLDRGRSVTWDCDTVNPPSAALALKLGFREETPFVELGFPGRATPIMSSGLWLAREEGEIIVWRRAGS